MFFTRFGLQGKIITIIAIAVISVVVVSTSIAMWLTRLPVEEEIYRKALAQGTSTAHELMNAGALENQGRLLHTLQQIQHDFPGVRQVDVYTHSPGHQLLATTEARGEHLELDQISGIKDYNEYERPEPDQITIETPDGKDWIFGVTLRDQGRDVACLNLRISKSRANVITWELVGQNLVLLLGSLAVIILVIHIFFLRGVRRPVKEMIQVMEATEGGQVNVRSRVTSQDEIGQLAEHLNLMLSRIEDFQSELTRKVEEATSELARANEELSRINEELFDTQKSLARSERLAVAGQLAASLAHEIGTPLNSISGHIQLLARRKSSDEVSQRRLRIIENQIENIVRTVKQLLSSTRKFDLRIEPLDLRSVMKESALLSSPALTHRRIKLQMDLARDCPPVYGDAGYLQQVFLNLINNSMDAMPDGGELRLRLRYPANGHDAQVAVEVSDTGHGIDPVALAHIFEPMFTTKRMGTGVGLGLAICEQIITQHGGTIQVESEAGHGTRFTIVLPLDCRERAEMVVESRLEARGLSEEER